MSWLSRIDPAPAPLASISFTITSVCVVNLNYSQKLCTLQFLLKIPLFKYVYSGRNKECWSTLLRSDLNILLPIYIPHSTKISIKIIR